MHDLMIAVWSHFPRTVFIAALQRHVLLVMVEHYYLSFLHRFKHREMCNIVKPFSSFLNRLMLIGAQQLWNAQVQCWSLSNKHHWKYCLLKTCALKEWRCFILFHGTEDFRQHLHLPEVQQNKTQNHLQKMGCYTLQKYWCFLSKKLGG